MIGCDLQIVRQRSRYYFNAETAHRTGTKVHIWALGVDGGKGQDLRGKVVSSLALAGGNHKRPFQYPGLRCPWAMANIWTVLSLSR
jgi:hypothetical protein